MKTSVAPTSVLAAGIVLLAQAVMAADISLASAPPVVVKTVPVAGATNVDPALTEIRVTFSKPMQGGSWSWSTWGDESFPEMAGKPRYLEDGRTCVLPVKMQAGKFYATWLNSDKFRNFKDTGGRPAVPYLLTFETAGANPGTTSSTRKFVRAIVGQDRMTFEGKETSWEDLDALLQAVPDRANAVLEWGVSSDQVTLEQQNRWTAEFTQRARRHGFGYASYVGTHPFGSMGGQAPGAVVAAKDPGSADERLNEAQALIVAWTDRQFGSFFDARKFEGWPDEEKRTLEARTIDTLKGPRTREYYQAINTLAALRSTNALPKLREIALEHRDKDNRDRWMAIRALGLLNDRASIPELIHLVYHGNINTRWWAQVSLVRLTGQNFGSDWQAWGKWWHDSGGQPDFNPEIIRWWSGQPEPGKLAETLAESDQKFLEKIGGKSSAEQAGQPR